MEFRVLFACGCAGIGQGSWDRQMDLLRCWRAGWCRPVPKDLSSMRPPPVPRSTTSTSHWSRAHAAQPRRSSWLCLWEVALISWAMCAASWGSFGHSHGLGWSSSQQVTCKHGPESQATCWSWRLSRARVRRGARTCHTVWTFWSATKLHSELFILFCLSCFSLSSYCQTQIVSSQAVQPPWNRHVSAAWARHALSGQTLRRRHCLRRAARPRPGVGWWV